MGEGLTPGDPALEIDAADTEQVQGDPIAAKKKEILKRLKRNNPSAEGDVSSSAGYDASKEVPGIRIGNDGTIYRDKK